SELPGLSPSLILSINAKEHRPLLVDALAFYGDEPWLGKSTIRRRVMLKMFREVVRTPLFSKQSF
ncbi:hypothetical protein, partial [Paenibacillus validus]